jgi:DNA invertase Pin-like site-specific DNA recombinase
MAITNHTTHLGGVDRGFVSYLRVSTRRQGESGLGLEAQRSAVARHVGDGRLVGEYLEVESGAKSDRLQLAAALAHARVTNSILIIAKLDRLARNVHFITGLMESGVDFIATDLPSANKLTIHILAAVAEYEREQISLRIKAALAAAKARGVKLGSPDGGRALLASGKGNTAAIAALQASAATWRSRLMPIVEAIVATGVTSPAAIARELDQRGILTLRGGKWRGPTVKRLLTP